MSRTTRRRRPKFWRYRLINGDSRRRMAERLRDGEIQYVSVGCAHNNSCSYCRNNRTFASRRRAPLEDWQ